MEGLIIHRLGRTDSLEMLSAMYRVPVCMIMRANELDAASQLTGCCKLRIPRKCFCNRFSSDMDAGFGNHTIQPGDTLYGIARSCGLTMRILLKANGLEDPEDIHPGDTLRIPRVQGEVYCVREGESLEDIAHRNGTMPELIRRHNMLGKDEILQPGMCLLL
jgi:hypothetical protein